MDFAQSHPPDGFLVLRRAVAFMAGVTVAGVFPIEFSHQGVAGGLGQHRGGGDRQRAAVRRAAVGTSQALGAGQVVVVKVERWIGNG